MPDVSERTPEPRRRLVLIFGAVALLLLCVCFVLGMLVLTGIIAEPETLLEEIVHALGG